MSIDATDRGIIEATQAGLPLCAAPYAEVARRVGIGEDEVMRRIRAMLESGVIRRIGAATNHYALGLTANGMTVWDVEDSVAERLGPEVGALDFVTHCYLRPRALPDWPYNLFAMVHGHDSDEIATKRAAIADLLGAHCRAGDMLRSTRILKKTGLRLARKGEQ